MPAFSKLNIAIFICFLFHFCGAIGILFTPYKDWFVNATPINLLVCFGLILFTHLDFKNLKTSSNKGFFIFLLLSFCIGFLSEVIGVNTGLLFGNYKYTPTFGLSVFNVPLLIGVQWFITLFCCCCIMFKVNIWAKKKLESMGDETEKSSKRISFSFIIDAALMATFFDYFLEPVAIQLGFWQWQNNQIPTLNYVSWFLISSIIVILFLQLKFNKENNFAIHLFIMQLLFFFAIRIYS